MIDYANWVGYAGVVCFLTGFFLLQKERVQHDSLSYLLLNLAGSVLVIGSLLVHWNLPVFVLEAAWALISIYGIYKHHFLVKRKTGAKS